MGSAEQLSPLEAQTRRLSESSLMVAPFGGFLSGLFFPGLLLLLSSIFNFPINQRVVLFSSLFLLEAPRPLVGSPSFLGSC